MIPECDWGSEATQLLALAGGLQGGPFDLHLATSRLPEPLGLRLRQAGFTLHVLAGGRILPGPAVPSILWLLRTIEPRIVHLWRVEQAWPVGLAARGSSRVPLVVDCRMPVRDAEWLACRAAELCRQLACRRVHHCTWWPPSPRGRQQAAWIPDHAGAEGHRPEDPAACRRRIRGELALGDRDWFVLTVGRLLTRKRLRDAIWAADLLKVVRDDVHLFIVGDGPERPQLVRFRDQVRIADRVKFLGPRGDVADLMRGADIYWSCSEREDVPQALLEALSSGLPCMVSDIPAHRDVRPCPGATEFFPLGDRAALARLALRHLEEHAASEVPRTLAPRPHAHGYPEVVSAPWTDYASLYRACLQSSR